MSLYGIGDDQGEIITVDDRVMCDKEGSPCGVSARTEGVLWPMILEKAVAKRQGCYERIISGYVSDGLAMLCGGDPETIKLQVTRLALVACCSVMVTSWCLMAEHKDTHRARTVV